jgi:transcription initiation factor IIE alpha subunit
MNVEECTKEKLWPILIETAHALVMYPSHKTYTHDVIVNEKPDVTPEELAVRLGIPLGEALTILYELAEERKLKP